jgi:hypothetical protein
MLKVGDKISVIHGVSANYCRGDLDDGVGVTLPLTRYIVTDFRTKLHDSDSVIVRLAAADWTDEGRTTFRSNKHIYYVMEDLLRDSVVINFTTEGLSHDW